MAIDFPWERNAMRNDPMPGNLSFVDACAYQAIASLYGRYRSKQINRDAAKREKEIIKIGYEEQKRKEESIEKSYRYFAKQYKNLESAIRDYQKSDDTKEKLDAADRFLREFG